MNLQNRADFEFPIPSDSGRIQTDSCTGHLREESAEVPLKWLKVELSPFDEVRIAIELVKTFFEDSRVQSEDPEASALSEV